MTQVTTGPILLIIFDGRPRGPQGSQLQHQCEITYAPVITINLGFHFLKTQNQYAPLPIAPIAAAGILGPDLVRKKSWLHHLAK